MIDVKLRAKAYEECQRAWLRHLHAALGPSFPLIEEDGAILLSSLAQNAARATLAIVAKTSRRVARALHGIAQTPASGKDILIVLDDDDAYYRYVSTITREMVSSPAAAASMSMRAVVTSLPSRAIYGPSSRSWLTSSRIAV